MFRPELKPCQDPCFICGREPLVDALFVSFPWPFLGHFGTFRYTLCEACNKRPDKATAVIIAN
jgi:hypothetical protein